MYTEVLALGGSVISLITLGTASWVATFMEVRISGGARLKPSRATTKGSLEHLPTSIQALFYFCRLLGSTYECLFNDQVYHPPKGTTVETSFSTVKTGQGWTWQDGKKCQSCTSPLNQISADKNILMVLLPCCILICCFLHIVTHRDGRNFHEWTVAPSPQTLPKQCTSHCFQRCLATDSAWTVLKHHSTAKGKGLPNLREFGGRNSLEASVALRLLQFTQVTWNNGTRKQTWSSIYSLQQSATHPTMNQAPEEKTRFKRSLSFQKPPDGVVV